MRLSGICEFQPTRPLRGATDLSDAHTEQKRISTHAPLAGRDKYTKVGEESAITFQPTRPLRGATELGLLAGIKIKDFNPRAPCGARQLGTKPVSTWAAFQPTRPLRGATALRVLQSGWQRISTHAPLAGRDHVLVRQSHDLADFNPRAPCGARHVRTRRGSGRPADFNPRAPCGARLPLVDLGLDFVDISTHAPLAGRD